jgi:molybdopterin-guanine dinucleotide biosynthesis protein A
MRNAMARDDVTTVVLAGGRATRLPGKLEMDAGGEPLLARVYHNLRDAAPIVVAGAGSFGPELDALLECPLIVDRWPGRGPLAGLLSAALELDTPWIFAVAGDAPHVSPAVLDALLDAREPNDEAIVAEHHGSLEPLGSLYLREALEREAHDVLHEQNGSMHALLDRLRARPVPLAADFFLNVNTVADLERL